jgi:hypothetical protein
VRTPAEAAHCRQHTLTVSFHVLSHLLPFGCCFGFKCGCW